MQQIGCERPSDCTCEKCKKTMSVAESHAYKDRDENCWARDMSRALRDIKELVPRRKKAWHGMRGKV